MKRKQFTPVTYTELIEETKKRNRLKKQIRESKPMLEAEESAFGDMPDPEKVTSETLLERAQEVGLYTENTEGKPSEVNVAQEVEEAEKARRGID